MKHAAVTLVLGLAMRLFGASAPVTIKSTTAVSIGGEIVQWHAGPCVRGSLPSPICGKPEREDAFMGIIGGLAAVAFTTKLPVDSAQLAYDRLYRGIVAHCDSVRKRLVPSTDELYRACKR